MSSYFFYLYDDFYLFICATNWIELVNAILRAWMRAKLLKEILNLILVLIISFPFALVLIFFYLLWLLLLVSIIIAIIFSLNSLFLFLLKIIFGAVAIAKIVAVAVAKIVAVAVAKTLAVAKIVAVAVAKTLAVAKAGAVAKTGATTVTIVSAKTGATATVAKAGAVAKALVPAKATTGALAGTKAGATTVAIVSAKTVAGATTVTIVSATTKAGVTTVSVASAKTGALAKTVAGATTVFNFGATEGIQLPDGSFVPEYLIEDLTELDDIEITINQDNNNKPVIHIEGTQHFINKPKYKITSKADIDYPTKKKPFTFYNEKMDGVKWSSSKAYPGFLNKLFGSKTKIISELRWNKIFYNKNGVNHLGVKFYNKTYDTKKWFFRSKITERWIRYDYYIKNKIIKSECFRVEMPDSTRLKRIFVRKVFNFTKKTPDTSNWKIYFF